MKLVWENERATVQAPKKLRSAFPHAPDPDRSSFNRHYHIGAMGAWQIQADIQAEQEKQQQKKRVGVMEWLSSITT